MKNPDDPLAEYRDKRDFSITGEPVGHRGATNAHQAYVIQKHMAHRTHYDLRLELEGVLKSWAVPKGPSLDPSQKRLAVEVEDHPLEYLDFEGEIPAGEYGAGSVVIWDWGTWEPEAEPVESLRAGMLKFRLHGARLQGGWVLVRLDKKPSMGKQNWLLIKERDAHAQLQGEFDLDNLPPDGSKSFLDQLPLPAEAKAAPMPATLEPQLASLADTVPPGDQWTYEIKYDGYRIMTKIERDRVHLFTRTGLDWTSKLKNLVPSLLRLGISQAWLDGEIVVLGEKGLPDFGALQDAWEKSALDKIHYYVFDLPYYAGFDLRQATVSERRKLLAKIMARSDSRQISFSDDFPASGQDILLNACRLGLEGVIGKRKDSNYSSGRSRNWIKLKCGQRQEFVVVGYTVASKRETGIKALLLGVYDESGNLQYVGRVGNGFDDQTRAALKSRLQTLHVDESPLQEPPEDLPAYWTRPILVAEISFSQWTKDGRLRHPVFRGLREDKAPESVVRESALEIPEPTNPHEMPAIAGSIPLTPAAWSITNPERVIDPISGITKLDLASYYDLASRKMLPHLDDRPVAFLRAPAGIDGQLFFQKHGETLKIPGLKKLDPDCDPGHPPLLEIDSVAALMGAVQMNVIEFHTWNATIRNISRPDRMVFDLDPGENTTWTMVQEAAELTRVLLDELGLRSFLKTSGGKGLHIVVPLNPQQGWDIVKDFSRAAAQHLAKVIPSLFTARSGLRSRSGRIYIDYNRNSRGATTVAAYSARARSGMGVSMPCAWAELSSLSGGAHYTVANAGPRLESPHEPWAGYENTKQVLHAASKKKLGLA